MTGILTLASLWLGLALIATLLAIWLRITTTPRGEREQQAPAAQPITAAGGGK
jgi:hypothetical protein